jgi:DNA repair protein SbcD/Mre11
MPEPMRILLTADWHLNDRLGRVERQPDIVARLEEIAGYLDQHEVDVLLVAGDLLSKYSLAGNLRTALGDVNRVFKPYLLRGGTIVIISGNHDHEATFAMLRTALDLASPIDPGSRDPMPRGRLYLVGQPALLLLESRRGQRVQFALLPYPTQARYLFDENTRYGSLEERNRRLAQALVRTLGRIRTEHIDPHLPSVLTAHIHVRGSQVHNLYYLSEAEDVVFDPSDIPTSWAYVALGHIHKPQALAGAPHVRYAGSVERLDYAERDEAKSCVLVEVGAAGRVGGSALLPLDATPIYRVEITDPAAEIPHLRDRYPDRKRALVDYRLVWTPGEHNLDEIRRELEMIFPRCYQHAIRAAGADTAQMGDGEGASLHDVGGTTRSYLEERLTGHPDRDALLALAGRYLDELEAEG